MPSEEKGRQAAAEGRAHEHIAVGLLMKRYQNVSLVDLPLSPYDIIIVRKLEDGREDIIRAQVKTAKKSISFIGGVRGGVDRTYKSDVKRYRQSTATSDVVLGVKEESDGSYSLYVVPTCLIEALEQDSISLRRIEFLKNNWEMLERCKDRDYVLAECARRGIVRPTLLEMDEE
ncbi:MAG: hypothetical protein NZ550_00205 [Fimbriimonadales bacterium]|nr:hypothetical protein [Fimbriimonadales bacterium]